MTTYTNQKITIQDIATSFPAWAHPDVHYYAKEWRLLRNTRRGERTIKENASEYLVKPAGMDEETFKMYVHNATYYNMVDRTIGALTGTIFKRNPVIANLPEELVSKLQNISIRAQTFRTFAKNAADERIHMSRYGVLLDRAEGGDPYLTGYVTESILDWSYAVVKGRLQLVYAVLMEVETLKPIGPQVNPYGRYAPRYRVLVLENGVYKQRVYRTAYDSLGTPAYPNPYTDKNFEEIIPTLRGATFDYIPFEIVGQDSNQGDISKSPIQDIADMNISHFRSYAELEHGRFYAGTPIYWVNKGQNSSGGEYFIGASNVWELGEGEKAGLLEMNGQGLMFLENALKDKEAHISTLGGRLIGVVTASTSESDNQMAMKDRNEGSLLLDVTYSLDESFTRILRRWAEWNNVSAADAAKIEIEFSKEFIIKPASAREFRAVHQMYTDGIIPIEVVYDYLSRADVIPKWLTMDEFRVMLSKPDSFLNNPDAQARQEGFPDAAKKLEVSESSKDRKLEQGIADADRLQAARTAQASQAAQRQQNANGNTGVGEEE